MLSSANLLKSNLMKEGLLVKRQHSIQQPLSFEQLIRANVVCNMQKEELVFLRGQGFLVIFLDL